MTATKTTLDREAKLLAEQRRNTNATKFTPGPWKITNEHGVHQIETAWNTVYGLPNPIARVTLQDSIESREANARLIASAPELVEALQDCITDPNAHCLTTENREVAMFKRLEAINQIARSLLAKIKDGK